jgi:hypothetical protein
MQIKILFFINKEKPFKKEKKILFSLFFPNFQHKTKKSVRKITQYLIKLILFSLKLHVSFKKNNFFSNITDLKTIKVYIHPFKKPVL